MKKLFTILLLILSVSAMGQGNFYMTHRADSDCAQNFMHNSSGHGTTGTSFDIPTPEANAGETMFVYVGQLNNTPITTPAGWSVVASTYNSTSGTVSLVVYSKVISSYTAAGTVTISTGATSTDKFGVLIKLGNTSGVYTTYNLFSSGIAYSSRTIGGATSPSGCTKSITAVIIRRDETPVDNPATGWTTRVLGRTGLGGGWGFGLQTYYYDSAETSTNTNFTFTSSYLATTSIIIQ